MKFFKNILFLAFVLSCFYMYSWAERQFHPITVSADALEPDLLLENVRIYTREHANNRSLIHLEKAINSMKVIEDDVDEKGTQAIEDAIDKLKHVYNEIQSNSINEKDLKDAFINAFNALTYAEISVTQFLINSDMRSDAMIALGYGKVHIKNALKFSEKDTFRDELKIYTELDELINREDMTKEEILERLNYMLEELDKLKVD